LIIRPIDGRDRIVALLASEFQIKDLSPYLARQLVLYGSRSLFSVMYPSLKRVATSQQMPGTTQQSV
jgi:hypothetical protein